MRSLACLALATLLAACTAASSSENDTSADDVHATAHAPVQMNDVSIVLPLAKSAEELDKGYLHATDLLPSDLYTKTTGFPAAPPAHTPVGSDIGMPYSQLRAVAYRIDPCFANIGPVTDAAACDNQLRVVFQSLTFTGGSTGAADGAIHAFYKLTRDELRGLLDDVTAARIANGGNDDLGPLQVHPIVKKQGLLGAESKALQDIVKKHASAKNLMRFTMFISGNLQTVWHFSGFDIAPKNGKLAATPMVIPTLPDDTTNESFFVGFGASMGGGFTPETTSSDNMQILGNLTNAKAASKAKQQAALDAAFAIENPNKHSPNTIDCASCHVAGPGANVTAARDLGLSLTNNKDAFTPPASVPAADMKQVTVPSLEHGLNVHNFSYRGDDLMIARRVINETASVVDYLNALP